MLILSNAERGCRNYLWSQAKTRKAGIDWSRYWGWTYVLLQKGDFHGTMHALLVRYPYLETQLSLAILPCIWFSSGMIRRGVKYIQQSVIIFIWGPENQRPSNCWTWVESTCLTSKLLLHNINGNSIWLTSNESVPYLLVRKYFGNRTMTIDSRIYCLKKVITSFFQMMWQMEIDEPIGDVSHPNGKVWVMKKF